MNVELLEKVKAHILEEPKRIRMEAWVFSEHFTEDDKAFARSFLMEEIYSKEHNVDRLLAALQPFSNLLDFPACGTVACIAGWGKILEQTDPESALRNPVFLSDLACLSEFENAARFGLEMRQALRLFYVRHWPVAYSLKYARAKTSDARAHITANRIDHFIATNGEE